MSITEKTAWIIGNNAAGNKEVVLADVGGFDINATPVGVVNHANTAMPDGVYETAIDLNPVTKIQVTTPPAKVSFTTAETLDFAGAKVTLTFKDESTEVVLFANFAAKGLTINPEQGAALTTTVAAVVVTHTPSGKTANQAITVT